MLCYTLRSPSVTRLAPSLAWLALRARDLARSLVARACSPSLNLLLTLLIASNVRSIPYETGLDSSPPSPASRLSTKVQPARGSARIKPTSHRYSHEPATNAERMQNECKTDAIEYDTTPNEIRPRHPRSCVHRSCGMHLAHISRGHLEAVRYVQCSCVPSLFSVRVKRVTFRHTCIYMLYM